MKTRSLGTILVISRSALFADVLASMIVAAGFTPAFRVETESVGLTMTRTQPCVVICDCSNAIDDIQRFLIEVATRNLPLLLCEPVDVPAIDRALATAHRVAWFNLPVSSAVFRGLIDGLLAPAVGEVHRVSASVGAVRFDAGINVRPLPIFPSTTGVYLAAVARRSGA